MKAKQLKKKFLEFFKQKEHSIINSASLIPENDPTALFITAGMHPLVPYLMGEKHPESNCLVNIQKCLRTSDIDEVGDSNHHTFFEMLGNWSLGSYFKKEAIDYSWELLIKILKLDQQKIAISVFGGNKDVPQYDQESEKYWLVLGIAPEKISKVADNWWGPAGQTGPCGPDTEVFYWTSHDPVPQKFDENDDRWVEIWNNVFMEYNKTAEGKFEKLKQQNVDTGMGLERTLAVLNNLDDNYLTELFLPLIKELEKISQTKYDDFKREFRIIIDHLRSTVFILGDQRGVAPSNTGQGYVLRRLIRRAIRFAKQLNIDGLFTAKLAQVVIDNYSQDYPELKQNRDFILTELEKEEIQFKKTLEKGLKKFDKKHPLYLKEFEEGQPMPQTTTEERKKATLSGQEAFNFFQTYGFPLEMIEEEAKNRNLLFGNKEKEKFCDELKKHQELSRTASAGMFKGGLADDSEMSRRYHTVAHLLLQSLRNVLGEHVEQRGSNINQERVRFDFVHSEKMTAEQIQAVENMINEQIRKNLPVSCQEMLLEEAKKSGATGIFDQKYGEKVKVYTIGSSSTSSENPFSREICGGPHVENTGELGHFKIIKEQSSSAGVRRIKAILE
ncbi:MAG: alanine--tRNA ligase [Candidatus Komeilibacteria bacterium CG11_big_fil_rev_8_21_14_0_20_36_20]|uniref:Alanine--tRNA ligase n=1 Tax=Candidatus Komeilibacteria bacterium CG11_big_fil_rev_8_21_14_0_20_36_20 TaxID=1974477 RepID=A0A2H0NBK0_9BACT|nr:MAG: alanine--tRNA ligase [Candidatus Komeilibacteria bacterium CG11_big_fil_rev_8_21_14_0_20_36_20]PIR81714.1 MAG: alanine--tRNA ligase [Candidatus Komeilibacteria bacterium CG10_big_fil_rev_8_21_14_0_10_36_65]PJC54913.1 MAG: alanine--tRNA ligase [Candidatus Komeilibacteria bacterium CG_4_9_14_0_2_um_filter_36_13]